MKKIKRKRICLRLFDGASAGDGTASGTAAEGTGSTEQNSAVVQRKGNKTGEKIVYGKVPEESPAAEDTEGVKPMEADTSVTSNTLDDKKAAFEAMINGDYKDEFGARVQQIIDRRFKETKGLQDNLEKVSPVIDMLMSRYSIDNNDVEALQSAIEEDDAYWQEAADQAGMSVEQYKLYQKLERENQRLKYEETRRAGEAAANAQLQQWSEEGEALKATYPDFDLQTELQNQEFIGLLRARVPMQHAFEVVHMDDIKNNIATLTSAAAEKKVVESVRQKGVRPNENGMAVQSGVTYKSDVSKLTKKDRREIAKRAQRGEHIEF